MAYRTALTAMSAALILASAAPSGQIILDGNDGWNYRTSWRTPVVDAEVLKKQGDPASEPIVLPVERTPFIMRKGIQNLTLAPPDASWMQPDFDDSIWLREKVGDFGKAWRMAGGIRMRGRFHVANVAAVKDLTFSAQYRGGMIVYLNGVEVLRKNLPEGTLTGDVTAAPYPEEAWVDAKGKRLPRHGHYVKRIKEGEKDLEGRFEARERTLDGVALPTEALHKGINTLAVAVFRSDYHPVAREWFNQGAIHDSWTPIRLDRIELRAAGTGITPVSARRQGIHVWNLDLHQRITPDYLPDPLASLKPIRIVGAKNGSFSGLVGVSSDQPIRGIRASVTDFKPSEGVGDIPSASVDVKYAVNSDGITRFSGLRRRVYCFDALVDEAPAEVPINARDKKGATQPIFVRVRVPKDAAAGAYRGTLNIKAQGLKAPVSVPIVLQVADWTVPDPEAFRTHVGFYQSPTSVAMQYGVEMWSEEHWKHLEETYKLLSRVDNDILMIPLVEKTQFGNDAGFVCWVKQVDGSFTYDFTVLNRFLDLVKKHVGVPKFVALQVWHAGGWSHRAVDDENMVTVLDPKTGKKTAMQVPTFGTPESKAFWKSALKAVRAELAKHGMEDSACLGVLSDSTAPDEVFQDFNAAAPDLGWTRGCHSANRSRKPYTIKGPATVVYHEHCYGMTLDDPADIIPKIWDQSEVPTASYFRKDFDAAFPLRYRSMAERSLYHGKRGIGRVGFDYWLFENDRTKAGRADLYNRWPHSSCAQRRPTLMKLVWASKSGPVTTLSYEQVVEGLQEAEAMITIAEAVDTKADRLGSALAAECRQLLVDRINYARVLHNSRLPSARDVAMWQKGSQRVYDTASKVKEKLGK